MIFRNICFLFLATVNTTTGFVVSPKLTTSISQLNGRGPSSHLFSEPEGMSPVMDDDSMTADAAAKVDEIVEETVSAEESSTDDEASTPAPVQAVRHTLYIGNVPFSSSEDELRELFEQHVTVTNVSLPRNRETDQIRGFGFIDVGSEEEIVSAVEILNGAELDGRAIRVSRSLEKDQIRSNKKSVDGARKLYVGNLSFDTTTEDLYDFFGGYGDVQDAFIPLNGFGKSRGFAFIFVNEEQADSLIDATNGVDFMGRQIAVSLPLPPGAKRTKQEKPGTMKIYVGNLSFFTPGETLSEVFSEFGDVLDSYIPLDNETNRSRGFGFVTMEREAGISAVDALNGCELDGRIISVNEAKPRSG